jgi:predicted negative regulator of RcsB-dependent stress response
MKFALGEIRGMKDPLVGLIDKEIPIKAAWKLNRLVKAFDKELGDIEEFRVGLVQKLGEEGEEGNVTVPTDKMEQFVAEFNELLSTEIDVEFESIDVDVFGDVQLSAKDMMVLEKIFK